jgi:hypothetical protein
MPKKQNPANKKLRFGQNWVRMKFGNFTQMHEIFYGHWSKKKIKGLGIFSRIFQITKFLGSMYYYKGSTSLATDKILYVIVSCACVNYFLKCVVFRVRAKFILRELSYFVFIMYSVKLLVINCLSFDLKLSVLILTFSTFVTIISCVNL